MTWAARLGVLLVRGYQLIVRPALPPACRFEPSCSEYCRQVVAGQGLLRGAGLAIRRIVRCHPWNAGGYDPPPLPRRPRPERPGA